jgi:DNA end-binding protein Ku
MDRVGVGKIVTGGKEHLVAVRPRDGALEMELLWWPEELKSDASATDSIAGATVTDTELVLGRKLLETMSRDFDPSVYRNEYAATLAEYLEAFVAGKEPVKLEARPVSQAPAMSVEDALTASLAALAEAAPKKKGKKEAAA